MAEIVELTRINFSSVFIAVFVILTSVKSITSLFEWIIGKLGLETRGMQKQREEHNLLIKTSGDLSRLQEQHNESVRQSIRHDEMIKSDLLSLTNMVNDIANTLKDMQSKENETKIKEIKSSLIRYYNKYKEIGKWSKLEKDAFWDLFDDYEKRGGDGYIHSIVEPAMRELEEID
ncbi:MAG: hypothetical protein NC251_12635 [Lachnoclostridium sp.]|nr:hypothetical protein [Lachnospira sp.]MCM1249260.1 hypothetical protein [Lachnoclostridium sp.]MCM1536401.1 hypothetical protein [Clostridium sp.]